MSGTNPRGLAPPDESHPLGSSPRCRPDVRIESLLDLFYGEGERHQRLGRFTPVEKVPVPYDRLLDHNGHMTVTVEAFHRQKVDVRVHRTTRSETLRSEMSQTHMAESATPRTGSWYAREITLVGSESGKVVQYGIVRLNVDTLSADVWRQIESQSVPLGRVLIENGVLREVQLQGLWRVEAGPALAELLDVSLDATVYGRTALIYCDGEPAIELLEIVVDR